MGNAAVKSTNVDHRTWISLIFSGFQFKIEPPLPRSEVPLRAASSTRPTGPPSPSGFKSILPPNSSRNTSRAFVATLVFQAGISDPAP